MTAVLTDDDHTHLRRCMELARTARDAGDQPFGSVLVAADGEVLQEARNTVNTDGDVTAHPELVLARWASRHLGPEQRAAATMFTSGEHCPMCAAAHAYAGVGRLVFAYSAAQLAALTGEPGWNLSVRDLFARRGLDLVVDGPAPSLREACEALHT